MTKPNIIKSKPLSAELIDNILSNADTIKEFANPISKKVEQALLKPEYKPLRGRLHVFEIITSPNFKQFADKLESQYVFDRNATESLPKVIKDKFLCSKFAYDPLKDEAVINISSGKIHLHETAQFLDEKVAGEELSDYLLISQYHDIATMPSVVFSRPQASQMAQLPQLQRN